MNGQNLFMEEVDVRLVMKHGIPVKLPQKQTNASDCQSLTVNLDRQHDFLMKATSDRQHDAIL